MSKNSKINQKLSSYLPGALHYNFSFPWEKNPVHFVDGNGHFIFDLEGKKHLDFFSKFGALFIGHKNKEYLERLSQGLRRVTAVDHFGEEELVAIEQLIERVPGADQARFSLSGTEAVQNALRLARAYTGKNMFIRFNGHYHGSMDNILGGSSVKEHKYIPREMNNDPRGTLGRAMHAFDDSILIPWGDISALKNAIKLHKNTIAAVLMEPVCINGGGVWSKKEYLVEMKQILEKEKVLLIFDEVITGFRLSNGSAQNIVGISPDIWIFGKAISGGSLPVSCIMSRKGIMEVYKMKTTTHGGTYNGYPLGIQAVGATLDILGEIGIYERTAKTSIKLKNLILSAAKSFDLDLSIQGHPLAMVIHASTKEVKTSSEWTSEMKLKEEIIRKAFLENCIMLAPPCRIYPNISINGEVIDFVTEKLPTIFETVKKKFNENELK
ncbi:aminotransferase class III-fold pyridoxal phosphate-dependent enzyme [Candidatus Dojkabacteria bacterium]|nr:aminotransferase class III-fold pyridoxal phosphate-dependent enzyme [Candidatus Dojkabacteria bacterium]